MERRLGRGGMGEVFLALDERLGRRVAIKRVRHGASPALRERFRREAKAAARLNHPAVVQIYDILEDGAGDAIVMEYAEGRTLRELLAGGLPPPALTVRLAREIAQGLAAAHDAGLVHRDLKAENVVVTTDRHAKILDFGLAKPLAEEGSEETLTEHGALLGTCHAMSPEQAGGGEVDARSDLFSFGVLLYEMLTGRSPFRGRTPQESLKRVLTDDPPPLGVLRPDLPAGLAVLVERLLEKDRDARPHSARDVARALEEVSSSPMLAGLPAEAAAVNEQMGELATAWTIFEEERSSALRPLPGRSRRLVVVAGLVVLALGAILLLGRFRPEPLQSPLRVAVLRPEVVSAQGEDLALAASGVLASALSALTALEGLAPLDPAQVDAGAGSPVEAARSAAADEVLAAILESQGTMGARLSLRRIQGSDGRVLWTDSFVIPTDPRDLRLLADAVAVRLRRAYPDKDLREGTPALDVRDEDYAAFLRIKQRVDQGGLPGLEELETILRSSPRFLEAHLLMAKVAQNLFRSTRDPAHLERGNEAVRAARALAPGDPRPLAVQLRLALAANRPAEARALLTELERLLPGDPELLTLSGQVAESEGDLERAISDLAAAVERIPSWSNLVRLADLEARAGRNDDARRHLEELLERNPGNLWGLDRLGNLELLAGDPARAERIYRDLLRRQPQRSHYTNLGLARMLLGRPAEAVEAYHQALALSPDHVTVLLNLADAELELGRREEAHALYRQVLTRLEESEASAGLVPRDRLAKAQCLVRLGRTRDAVAQVQRALQDGSEDPEVAYLASLVYSLAGERASALVNAETALRRGVQPRWFSLPAFDALREDPDFQVLLRQAD
ncbi:MAG TPA: protein kinase [Thermoanaerobaculia bacterium]|nr:protein kinase [Thermoanaerobaculia bacterium]